MSLGVLRRILQLPLSINGGESLDRLTKAMPKVPKRKSHHEPSTAKCPACRRQMTTLLSTGADRCHNPKCPDRGMGRRSLRPDVPITHFGTGAGWDNDFYLTLICSRPE
jgi:hypothetical protein